MRFFYLLILILVTATGCEKEISPEEKKQQQLSVMRTHLVNDWKISKVMTVKPVSEYGAISTSACDDGAVFSFKKDGTFNYTGNSSCFSTPDIPGVWSLPKSDSLFIRFTGNWIIGAYEKLEITELTANTLKWNIVAATGNGNPNVTLEYTLVSR